MDFQEYQELRDGLLAGSESCQARARQWLKETRVPKFKYNHIALHLLAVLLKTAPDDEVIEHAKALMRNADENVGYEDLGIALIDTVPDGRELVMTFLKNNSSHIEFPYVVSMMLENSLSSCDEDIVVLAQQWLKANPNKNMTPILLRDLKRYLKRRKNKP